MNRRTFLTTSYSWIVVSTAGCVTEKSRNQNEGSRNQRDVEEYCSKEWSVIVSNLSEEVKSLTIKIIDNSGIVLFSDTLKLEQHRDTFAGIEIDAKVQYDQQYTFEASLPESNTLNTEEVVNCGDIYIFVKESDEIGIRTENNRGDL